MTLEGKVAYDSSGDVKYHNGYLADTRLASGEDLRIYPIYLSGLIILTAMVIRAGKGLKIILNNKDVLIFYLILYLCTLEILPLLIFYRFVSSSVQVG